LPVPVALNERVVPAAALGGVVRLGAANAALQPRANKAIRRERIVGDSIE
jgi:hypothetical protein